MTDHPLIDDPWEHMVYWSHVRAAADGLPAMLLENMAGHLDCGGPSTVTGIEQRLERKGWITVERFHRGRRITIMATGLKTKQPANMAPHWRHRPEHGCEPVTLLKVRNPELYRDLIKAARRERRSMAALLADLIADGWKARLIQSGSADAVGGEHG